MLRIYLELLLATSFWGFGFVTTVWALTALGPLWLTALRFLVAIPFLMFLHRFRFRAREFKAVFLPGFSLFLLLAFQTWGLLYTSPTKSGFITVLYVLFVPVFERIFMKVPVKKSVLIWIAMALLGAALICGGITSEGISKELLSAFNFGDFLTLLCAMAAAAQFILVSIKVKEVESPVDFHIYQSSWIAIFAVLFAVPIEGFDFLHREWTSLAWLGFLQLAVFSSGLAFLIQIRVQRTLSPSTVAIFMLLESPWALLSSAIFLQEKLTGFQFLGAGLILFAAVAETLSMSRRSNH